MAQPNGRRNGSGNPIRTLADLRRGTPWVIVYCEICPHARAVALAPIIIGYGSNSPVDLLRRQTVCLACGAIGSTIRLPSFDGTNNLGAFPVQSRLVWSQDRRDFIGRDPDDPAAFARVHPAPEPAGDQAWASYAAKGASGGGPWFAASPKDAKALAEAGYEQLLDRTRRP